MKKTDIEIVAALTNASAHRCRGERCTVVVGDENEGDDRECGMPLPCPDHGDYAEEATS